MIHDIIPALYKALLGRVPGANEISLHEEAYTSGASLDAIVCGIADSPEAKKRQIEQNLGAMTVTQAMAYAPVPDGRMLVDVHDILDSIAQAYTFDVHREASFREVSELFVEIRQGKSIAQMLAKIAQSDEARAASTRKIQLLDPRDRFAQVMDIIYRRCLNRGISAEEVDVWFAPYSRGMSFGDILVGIDQSEEAASLQTRDDFSEWIPGTFVQLVFEIIFQRGATPTEICQYRELIERGALTRSTMLSNFTLQTAREAIRSKSEIATPANDPTRSHLFGVEHPVDIAMWTAKEAALANQSDELPRFSRFLFTSSAAPLVSVITSLYKGGRFLDAFLQNITSQSIFEDHCELLIIDANSPEGEFERASEFLSRFPNIKYERCNHRLGIYEAWNLGVQNARGKYCTNANLDDCRRNDSLELQAATLDNLDFVDIVYQDTLYSFDANLSYEVIAKHGFSTSLPIVSRYNLLEFNMPHNGPMWRKTLHDDVGLFNAQYKSAGDFDFWVRCHEHGKVFYKINDPHVTYYVNPQGLSTRTDTPGALEARMITKGHCRKFISENLTMEDQAFADHVGKIADVEVDGRRRYAVAQAVLGEISKSANPRSAKVGSS